MKTSLTSTAITGYSHKLSAKARKEMLMTVMADLTPIKSLRSLAYKTDLSILAFKGRIEDRKDYIVAESLGNPGYFWGNLLIMKRPPAADDFEVWTHLFKQEFSHQPLVKHMTFGWDSTDGFEGRVDTFLRNGFELERSVVLTLRAEQLLTPKPSSWGLDIRPLESDWDLSPS